jgi:hypothetical protein
MSQHLNPRLWRWLALGWGAAALIWLGLEDSSSLPVALLGIGGALLATQRPALAPLAHKPWGLPVIGALTGALAAILTTFLMFFKNAWHAHLFLDYPTGMLLAMLERLPWWALVGALLGLALRLWPGRSAVPDD